jgi:hypothetical protein
VDSTFRLVIHTHEGKDIPLQFAEAEEVSGLHQTGTEIAPYITGATLTIQMRSPSSGKYIPHSYFYSNGERVDVY